MTNAKQHEQPLCKIAGLNMQRVVVIIVKNAAAMEAAIKMCCDRAETGSFVVLETGGGEGGGVQETCGM